jgi:hypothetical protein
MNGAAHKFWPRVQKGMRDACWEYTGSIGSNGYGLFSHAGRTYRAHRLAWMLTHGPIPEGLYVCHTCDNRPCVNPAHLFLGTHTDNVRDMVAKGRNVCPAGERNGFAKFTDAQVAAIRADHRSNRPIAREYGCSHQYISVLKRGLLRKKA